MEQNQNLIRAAQFLDATRANLMASTKRLVRYNKGKFIGNKGDGVSVHIFGVSDGLLKRDHELMCIWTKLIAELSSTPITDDYCVNLTLERVVDEGVVGTTLLDAIKTLHRPRLLLKITPYGALFASKALEINPTVQQLAIDGGDESAPLESKRDVEDLVKAVINHPTLEMLSIANCDLSRKPIIKTLVPVLYHIQEVRFIGAGVGYRCNSYGPKLIATILKRNPRVKALSLDFNALEDKDAFRLAKALKTNTTLRKLSLGFNELTVAGMSALVVAMIGDTSFNSIHDANHHCFIDLLSASKLNMFDDPEQNRRLKIFSKISSNIGRLGDAVPTELVPRLLIILQGQGIVVKDDKLVFNPLNLVYQYVREFNATLFNTSGTDLVVGKNVVVEEMDNECVRKFINATMFINPFYACLGVFIAAFYLFIASREQISHTHQ